VIGGRKLSRIPGGDLVLAEGALAVACWRGGGFRLIVSIDPTIHGPLVHASLSHKHRDPTWTEIREMREAVWRSDQDVMMVLPREADYINVHEHCFHLWSMPVAWGIQ
jgi:hypothetical protein